MSWFGDLTLSVPVTVSGRAGTSADGVTQNEIFACDNNLRSMIGEIS